MVHGKLHAFLGRAQHRAAAQQQSCPIAGPKPSPQPQPRTHGMQRQGNKRERYQVPAEPRARAELGRKAERRERRNRKKKKKEPTLNPEITYHSGCITHLESADTKM